MANDRNVTNPGTFGHGVTDAATVAEEHARVEQLRKLLGPAVDVLGLEYSAKLRDAITSRTGILPEFKAE